MPVPEKQPLLKTTKSTKPAEKCTAAAVQLCGVLRVIFTSVLTFLALEKSRGHEVQRRVHE